MPDTLILEYRSLLNTGDLCYREKLPESGEFDIVSAVAEIVENPDASGG